MRNPLTKILPGCWYDADTVVAMQVYQGKDEVLIRRRFRRVVKPAVWPSLVVYFLNDFRLTYSLPKFDDLINAAAVAAGAVNATRAPADAVKVDVEKREP